MAERTLFGLLHLCFAMLLILVGSVTGWYRNVKHSKVPYLPVTFQQVCRVLLELLTSMFVGVVVYLMVFYFWPIPSIAVATSSSAAHFSAKLLTHVATLIDVLEVALENRVRQFGRRK